MQYHEGLNLDAPEYKYRIESMHACASNLSSSKFKYNYSACWYTDSVFILSILINFINIRKAKYIYRNQNKEKRVGRKRNAK